MQSHREAGLNMVTVNLKAAIAQRSGKVAIDLSNIGGLSSIIKSLFSNGEQGFFYDPNDLSTMYQDAAGTVPVTAVGQPVGLIKDKSGKNNHAYQTTSAARPILRQKPILGSELIANGDFSNGTTGWAGIYGGVLSTQNGNLVITSGGTSEFAGAFQQYNFVSGRRYKISFKVVDASQSTGVYGFVSANNTGSLNRVLMSSMVVSAGFYEAEFTAANDTKYITIGAGGGGLLAGEAIYFDNVSVKEVTGYYTDQNYIKYDGVDDKLTTSFPAPLTNATIVRAVPGVGAQILTGQSIPATYEDNKDHCGLIVINRALTPSETSAITAELNKRAGV